MTICLVREAGGFGDILTAIGAPARGLKQEQPDEQVVAFVPEEFVVVASHLEGVDKVESLGSLKTIQVNRRNREAPLDIQRYPYLKPLEKYAGARWVSLWCSGFLYETTCSGPLEYNRAQLFSLAAGVRNVRFARAKWLVDDNELERVVFMYGKEIDPYRKRVAVQFRGTCPARCLPLTICTELASKLCALSEVLVFDCVPPLFPAPRDAHTFIGLPIPEVAALVSTCDLIVSVDSFLWHLAAALGKPAVGVFGPTDGGGAARSYPMHIALDGEGTLCRIACNYNSNKGWNKKCRVTGCERWGDS